MNPYPYLAMFVAGAFIFALCGEIMSMLEYAPREPHTEARDSAYRTLWMVQLFSAFLSVVGIFQLRTFVTNLLHTVTSHEKLDQENEAPRTAQEST